MTSARKGRGGSFEEVAGLNSSSAHVPHRLRGSASLQHAKITLAGPKERAGIKGWLQADWDEGVQASLRRIREKKVRDWDGDRHGRNAPCR
jgi:hypothetical protein